jgi:hypothetical protein
VADNKDFKKTKQPSGEHKRPVTGGPSRQVHRPLGSTTFTVTRYDCESAGVSGSQHGLVPDRVGAG